MLTKAELKKQLSKLGVQVTGNHVKKKDLVRILADDKPQKEYFSADVKEIVFDVYVGGSDIDKSTLLNFNEALWSCVPKELEGPRDGTYKMTFDVDDDSNMSAFVENIKKTVVSAISKVI
jgi:hypothetical protein